MDANQEHTGAITVEQDHHQGLMDWQGVYKVRLLTSAMAGRAQEMKRCTREPQQSGFDNMLQLAGCVSLRTLMATHPCQPLCDLSGLLQS